MKRDMDLLKLVLLESEGSEAVDFGDWNEAEISYHRYLAIDAGLARGPAPIWTADGQCHARILSLTWDGHEFLEAARNETIWRQAKETVKDRGGTMTFEVLKALLIRLAVAAVIR